MQYVGDQIEVTFTSVAGATVTVSWISPSGTVVVDNAVVEESDTTPGAFTASIALSEVGVWEARFVAGGNTPTKLEQFHIRALPVGLPPLATVGEVGELYGTLTPAQETLTKGLLRRGSSMLRSRFPDFADRVNAGTLDADAPGHALVNMVLRVLRNPDGLRSETTGPFSRAYDTTHAVGLLVVTPVEEDLLQPPADEDTSVGVGTVIGRPSLLGYQPWKATRARRW